MAKTKFTPVLLNGERVNLILEFNEETEFDTSFSPISDLEIDQIISN